ncbi:hypothetical protein ANN_19858 [Periplaneta americana]|uniref:Uncharacterized protein n=1 Tax=Periplaneta americana TaxID=6978 RepID=A0ABQ8SB10_PERAM|nr:hypothetical protein ANN_19858 [Periplaneta americana]
MTRFFIYSELSFTGIKIYLKLTTGRCTSKKRMDGKTVIVTGANTGIGKETARDLARRGARVILACRDMKKAEEALKDIVASTGNSNLEAQHLDVSSLASVRKFADHINKTENRLDVLVNNAGVAAINYKLTSDNLLIGMQVNHFGPFLLTCLLIELLKRSAPSRIIMVSSVLHAYAKFDIDNLNSEKWFSSTQITNILNTQYIVFNKNKVNVNFNFTTGVTANSLHPGAVLTDVWRHLSGVTKAIVTSVLKVFCKDAVEGAQTTIYLAVSEEVEGVTGKYFVDCKVSN